MEKGTTFTYTSKEKRNLPNLLKFEYKYSKINNAFKTNNKNEKKYINIFRMLS